MRNEIISSHQLLREKTKTTLLHRRKANPFTLFHGVAVKHYWLTFAVEFLQLNLNERYKDVCLTISLEIVVTLQKNNHIVNASSMVNIIFPNIRISVTCLYDSRPQRFLWVLDDLINSFK